MSETNNSTELGSYKRNLRQIPKLPDKYRDFEVSYMTDRPKNKNTSDIKLKTININQDSNLSPNLEITLDSQEIRQEPEIGNISERDYSIVDDDEVPTLINSNDEEKEPEATPNILMQILNSIQETKNSIDVQLQETRNSIQETKNSIDVQLQETKNSIDVQLQETRNSIQDTTRKAIQESRSLMEDKLGQTHQMIEEMRKQIILDTSEEMRKFKEEISQSMQEKIEENNHIIQIQINNNQEYLEDKFNKHIEHSKQEYVNKEEVGDKLKEIKNRMQNNKKETENWKEEIKTSISGVQEEQQDIKESIQNIDKKLERHLNTDNNISGNCLQGPREILITCTGNNGNDLQMPKFNGRNKNPKEYLEKFKIYYKNLKNRRNNINCPNLEETIELSLEGSASRWWQVIKQEVQNEDDFDKIFLQKYWNSDIQRGIKRRLELEKYQPRGRLNRSEYFIERVILLQQMKPPIEESEIVAILSEHFDENIQDARRVQDLNTIQKFSQFLTREDTEEDNRKFKYRTNENIEMKNHYRLEYQHRLSENKSNGGEGSRNPEKYQGNFQNSSYKNSTRPYQNFKYVSQYAENSNSPYKNNYTRPYNNNKEFYNNNYKPNFMAQSQNTQNKRPYSQYPSGEQEKLCQFLSVEKPKVQEMTNQIKTPDNGQNIHESPPTVGQEN